MSVADSGGSTEIAYVQSTYSGGGNCVEAGPDPGANLVAVRSSRSPDAARLLFTSAEWVAFIKGVKAGQFDFGLPV